MTAGRLVPILLLLAACAARSPSLTKLSDSTTDEIWIIARSGEALGRTSTPRPPRMLAGTTADAVPLALQRTDVEATVVGPFAAVRMRQTYAGPDTTTDGAFVLPLAPGATLYDLVLTLGSRHIRAVVRPREEAEALYAAALGSGRAASLLREEDGVVLGLAQLAARTPIDVELSYAAAIPWRDGAWELVVPRVPGGAIDVRVDLDALGPISTVESPTHAIERATIGEDRVRVGLRGPATLRDTDFVLRYAVAADTSPGGGVAVSSGGRGSAAVLVLHPVVRRGRPLAFGVDTIDWGTLAVEGGPRVVRVIAASPEGVPFVLSGRVVGGTASVVRVTMADAGRRSVRALPVRAAPAGAADALSILLASKELETLTDDRDARRELALRYGLVSSETALVVVDATAPPQ